MYIFMHCFMLCFSEFFNFLKIYLNLKRRETKTVDEQPKNVKVVKKTEHIEQAVHKGQMRQAAFRKGQEAAVRKGKETQARSTQKDTQLSKWPGAGV